MLLTEQRNLFAIASTVVLYFGRIFAVEPAVSNEFDPSEYLYRRFGDIRLRHSSPIRDLQFSQDESMCLSLSEDNVIKIWELKNSNLPTEISGGEKKIGSAFFSPDCTAVRIFTYQPLSLIEYDLTTKKETCREEFAKYRRTADYVSIHVVKRWKELFLSIGSFADTVKKIMSIMEQWSTTNDNWPSQYSVFCVGNNGDEIYWVDQRKNSINSTKANEKKTEQVCSSDYKIFSILKSPDGKKLFYAGMENKLHLWNVQDRSDCAIETNIMTVTCAAAGRAWDGKQIVALGGNHGPIEIVDFSSETCVNSFRVSSGIKCVSLSPKGHFLSAGGQLGIVWIWKLDTKERLRPSEGHTSLIEGSVVLGKKLLTNSLFGEVIEWNIETGKQDKVWMGTETHPPYFRLAARSPSFISFTEGGTDDQRIIKVQSFSAFPINLVGEQTLNYNVQDLIFSSSGKYYYTLSRNRIIESRSAVSGKVQFVFELPENFTGNQLSVSEQEDVLVVFGSEGLEFFDISDPIRPCNRLRADFANRKDGLFLFDKIILSADSRFLLGTSSGKWQVWETLSGKVCCKGESKVPISSACFLLRSGIICLGHSDGTISLLDLTRRCKYPKFLSHQSEISNLSVSDDGRFLVCGSKDTTASMWRLEAFLKNEKTAMPVKSKIAFEQFWNALAIDSSENYFESMLCGLDCSDGLIPQLEKQISISSSPNPVKVNKLIDMLQDKRFTIRQQAIKELKEIGEGVRPTLQNRLKLADSIDEQVSIIEILDVISKRSEEDIRSLRVVQFLEYLGTPESIALLKRLSKGADGTRVTEAARRALKGLIRR